MAQAKIDLKEKAYAVFDPQAHPSGLGALCLELLAEQKRVWPDCGTGCASLERIKTRDVRCNGFSVRLQHNPGRIRSTLAGSEKKGTEERPCFLCLDNLPEEQKGILYNKTYLILCNPAPVFPSHFTVVHVGHCPQAIDEHIDTFVALMGDLGEGWTILYNGPQCGASAPDHFHFQAIPSGLMPVEAVIREQSKCPQPVERDNVRVWQAQGLGRTVIVLEGDAPGAVVCAFRGLLDTLREAAPPSQEPMLNMAGLWEKGGLRLLVFPRAKHRPDAFFREGDERVVVSPAVIEMGGVLVTPVERDFERLDAPMVEGIYREVSREVACLRASGAAP